MRKSCSPGVIGQESSQEDFSVFRNALSNGALTRNDRQEWWKRHTQKGGSWKQLVEFLLPGAEMGPPKETSTLRGVRSATGARQTSEQLRSSDASHFFLFFFFLFVLTGRSCRLGLLFYMCWVCVGQRAWHFYQEVTGLNIGTLRLGVDHHVWLENIFSTASTISNFWLFLLYVVQQII